PAGSARRAVRSQRDPRRATIVNDNALPNVPAERAVDLPDPPPACPNCGAPQLGPYCYACGQPEKGPVRYLPDILRDLSDLAFNVDSRIFRSLWVMYVRPGFLTTEYFAGRRKRYSSPFRMFFVLCIVAFLAMQLYVGKPDFGIGPGDGSIATADSPAEVNERLATALAALHAVDEKVPIVPAEAQERLAEAEADIRDEAARRIAWLEQRDAALAAGEVPKPDPDNPEIP